jgi:uncharacterized protein YkwD
MTHTTTPTPRAVSTTPEEIPAEIRRLERQMVEAVNAQRRTHGLPPYQVDDKLTVIARRHSEDMVTRGYFGHATPEGVTFRDRLASVGITVHWAGENIQRNSRATAPSQVVVLQLWFSTVLPVLFRVDG